MFVQKIQVSIILIILAAAIHTPEASTPELDSFGRMPEITVTAPRYENQDEAWLGMVEGVVVQAQRPSSSGNEVVAEDRSSAIVSGSMSSKDSASTSMLFRDSVSLLVTITLALATLSILFMSLGAYFPIKEVK